MGDRLFETSLRDRLRAATTEDHAALDAKVTGWRIETPIGYGAFLYASYAALAPLELALEQAGIAQQLPDWSRRARRTALAADLAELGLEASSLEAAAIPSSDFAAGLLYVLEGSRLGAKVLVRQVRAAGADLPLSYLTHGEGQDLWRSFLAWLDARPKVGFRTDAAEAGARYGFQRFSEAFRETRPSGALNVRNGAHVRV